jgi:prepilin-type N-terminal cleavage/methylation domain-containing protein
MKTKTSSAFTLIELLVVIAIIAVLAAFAVPAITSALTKGQLVGSINNARQFYLAGYQMALDGNTNADVNYNWPGDYNAPAITTLSAYSSKLVTNQYLKTGDVGKLLSGPGAIVGATSATDPSTGVVTVTLSGTLPGLKVYEIHDGDSANTIFAVSANYTYNTALPAATSPFGDKGFVVMRKGGDALSLRKNNALASSYPNASAFQSAVGKLTGDADGTLGSETSALVLAFP